MTDKPMLVWAAALFLDCEGTSEHQFRIFSTEEGALAYTHANPAEGEDSWDVWQIVVGKDEDPKVVRSRNRLFIAAAKQ